MRVLHIVPSFYPATYHGGPIYSIYHLCNALSKEGVELRVLTTDTAGPGNRIKIQAFPLQTPSNYLVYYCRKWAGVSVSPGLIFRMISLLRWADVVHLTAVYSFPTLPALFLCRLLNKPVIWSPRGSLERWQGSTKLRLKLIWEKICKMVMPKRIILHVTSEAEGRQSAKHFSGIKIKVIANGVILPDQVAYVPGNGTLRLLYLGRLDPKKGIENLLEACQKLNEHFKGWELMLAGFGEPSYTEKIRRQVDELHLSDQVRMLGKVEGEKKTALFAASDLMTVPSYTENFAMVVAEALAHGVPVIASRGTPWQRLEEMDCGLWVKNDPESLAQAIHQMKDMPLRDMGERGRHWMQEEFSWNERASQMRELYFGMIQNKD